MSNRSKLIVAGLVVVIIAFVATMFFTNANLPETNSGAEIRPEGESPSAPLD